MTPFWQTAAGAVCTGIAKIVQAVGLDQRSIGIGDLIGPGVEQIERVELNPPAILEPIADPAVEDAGGRRPERIVLGERARAEIAPAQRTEPAGLLADGDPGGGHHRRRIGDVVAGRVADLRLRKSGQRSIEFGLLGVEADKPRVRQRQIAVQRQPGSRADICWSIRCHSAGWAGSPRCRRHRR